MLRACYFIKYTVFRYPGPYNDVWLLPGCALVCACVYSY
jgi:hypothetical protein